MSERLYLQVARRIVDRIVASPMPMGARLPAERELARELGVSRPTIREAMLALEVKGIVEVRLGSGAFVISRPATGDFRSSNISRIELIEARLLFESEAAALAATQISDAELLAFEGLLNEVLRDHAEAASMAVAVRAFHLAIAHATRNEAVIATVERLWDTLEESQGRSVHEDRPTAASVARVRKDHRAILASLKARDPLAARAAMRQHLGAVLESLLSAAEERAVRKVREEAATMRARYMQATG